jgi:hypothetical protein
MDMKRFSATVPLRRGADGLSAPGRAPGFGRRAAGRGGRPGDGAPARARRALRRGRGGPRPGEPGRRAGGPGPPVRLPGAAGGRPGRLPELVAAFEPNSGRVEALRQLRSQLVLRRRPTRSSTPSRWSARGGRGPQLAGRQPGRAVLPTGRADPADRLRPAFPAPAEPVPPGAGRRAGLAPGRAGREGRDPAPPALRAAVGAAGRHRAAQPAGAAGPPGLRGAGGGGPRHLRHDPDRYPGRRGGRRRPAGGGHLRQRHRGGAAPRQRPPAPGPAGRRACATPASP